MNKDRITKLANVIGMMKKRQFDMDIWGVDDSTNPAPYVDDIHSCRTNGCICGWAVSLFGESECSSLKWRPFMCVLSP